MAGAKKAGELPAMVKIKMQSSVMHHEPGAPGREFPAGYVALVERPLALRWFCRGLADLVDYEPSRGELLEAARSALADFEQEQMNSGQTPERWERTPWVARRLERLTEILAADAPHGEAA